MHELSIANSIVDSVLDAVLAERSAAVVSVRVRVGAMSGVVPEALAFAWSSATSGTRLEGSGLEIERVAAAAWCAGCGREVELPGMTLRCPDCGAATPDVRRGRELDMLSVELSDESKPAPDPAAHPRGAHEDPQEE